jgi:hypothetical protein
MADYVSAGRGPRGQLVQSYKSNPIRKEKIMTFRKLASILVCLAGLAGVALGQTALTETTLASAVSGPSFYNGNSQRIDQTVVLTSVSGISAPTLPGTPVSVIYVGREAMGVFAVNTTLKTVNVFRGYLGTQASPHPSGDMVLIQNTYSTGNGANPLPSGFFQSDPPQGGACTTANVPTTPWVNVLTGAQWLCSTVTGTWVPGFNNPLYAIASAPTKAVASATTIVPSGPFFHLTGTTSISTITPPIGCDATAVGGCQITVICDGVCTWGTGGNIAVAAGTVVAGTPVTFIWDAVNSLWVPTTKI